MKSKEYIVEGKTTAYKVQMSVYNSGSLKGKIAVMIARLGPFFWDVFEHNLFRQPELAQATYDELVEKANELAKEGGE